MSVDTYRVKKPKLLSKSNTRINDRATRARLCRAEDKWMERTKEAHDAYVAESPARIGLRARYLLQIERSRSAEFSPSEILELGRVFDEMEALP